MARVGLNIAEVAAAVEKLLTSGEQPTAEKIHSLLGKGSIPGVQKLLTQIFEQSRLDLVTPAVREPEPIVIENRNELPADLLTAPAFEAPHATDAPPAVSEPVISAPAFEPRTSTEAAASTEAPAESTPETQGHNQNNRRPMKRERFTRNNQNGSHNNNPHANQNRHAKFEEPVEILLENLSDEALAIKIRRLESILLKEQMRREVAERITEETREYAESIKEQVAQRINDLRQNMDIIIEQLKAQLREQKHNFDQDLSFYQEQLSKANEKIASLVK